MAKKHELWELQSMQAAPLSTKIRMTERRIQEWIDWWGEDHVAISFSGGKDSTVLMDIIRNRMGYKNIPAVFVDVPTQYPELKEFALTWDNVEVLKPKISFMQVCEKYGFPLVSKEVSECVQGAKKYFTSLMESDDAMKERLPYSYWYQRVTGTGKYQKNQNKNYSEGLEELANILSQNKGHGSNRITAKMFGMLTKENKIQANASENDRSNFSLVQHKYLLEAPFDISNKCCDVMKKNPIHEYSRETKRKQITAQMASESRLRTQNWLNNGCNIFEAREPISNPMSFWTEQDVLLYIRENNLPICSVYGEIVEDWGKTNDVEGQMTISDLEGFEGVEQFDAKQPPLTTTGCKRTGCMLCGFGCHLEKPGEGRFELLKKTHPKMYALLDVVQNNGWTMRQAIEWMNEHGNLNIKL